MLDQARAELAPTGVLRAGINMSNFLLVTGKTADGDPDGVSPDMVRAVAERLGVPLKLVPFKSPGELADALERVVADEDEWASRRSAARQRLESHHAADACMQARLACFGDPE